MDYFPLFICLLVPNVATVSSLQTFDMDDYCGREVSMIRSSIYQGRLQLDIQRVFKTGYIDSSASCETEIESWFSYKRIMFHFDYLNLPCDVGYISIFDGSSSDAFYLSGLPHAICGSDKPIGTFSSSGRSIAIRYTPLRPVVRNYVMDLVFTAFHEDSCESYEYSCDNGRCIRDDLNCNGNNPCGDESDCTFTPAVGIIVGAVVGGLVLVGTVVTVIVIIVCCRRRRRPSRGVMQPYMPSQTVTSFNNGPAANQTAATGAPPGYSSVTATAPPSHQWTSTAYSVQSYPGQQAPGLSVSTIDGSAYYNTGFVSTSK